MARMKAEDRRKQLIESAAHCFARYGYRGTTTAKIAAEAGRTLEQERAQHEAKRLMHKEGYTKEEALKRAKKKRASRNAFRKLMSCTERPAD